MTIRNITAALVAVAALVSVNTAKADTYDHIDSLACSLERQTGELQDEFSLHFRYSPYYRFLSADVASIRHQAEIVHDLVRNRTCEYRLSSVLRQMDYAFLHLEGLVAQTEASARRGFGHVDRANSAHVRCLMNDIADTIRLLRADLALLSRPVHRPAYRPTVRPVPVDDGFVGRGGRGISRPPIDRGGLTFRSGNFTFRIGN